MRHPLGLLRLLLLLGVALAVAVLLAACGSGSSEPTDEEGRELLERVLLTVEDVPAGLQPGGSVFTTNEEAAEAADNPNTELSRFEIWGRNLGYRAVFVPGPDASPGLAVGVEAEATLFGDSAGARFWFDDRVAQARAQLDAAQAGNAGALTDMEVTEIDAQVIAPNAYWIRTSGFETEEPVSLRVDNQVLFLVAEVAVFLRVDVVVQGVSDRTFFATEFVQLAQLMHERLTAEFAAGDP
ncbi:MAG: hypothetical protein IIA90_00410 [Chloroflexi bacterium]|nr:hypothetical protein [Chloroflexota bacterium]